LGEFYFDNGLKTIAEKALVKAKKLATELEMTFWKDKAHNLLAKL